MPKRKDPRKYATPKYELINQLYAEQAAVCPLCKQSLLPDLQMYVAWKTKQLYNGSKLRRKDVNLGIDHIKAKSKGGADTVENLALVHRTCNAIKDDIEFEYERPQRTSA